MKYTDPFPYPVYSHRLSLEIALKTNADAARTYANAPKERYADYDSETLNSDLAFIAARTAVRLSRIYLPRTPEQTREAIR